MMQLCYWRNQDVCDKIFSQSKICKSKIWQKQIHEFTTALWPAGVLSGYFCLYKKERVLDELIVLHHTIHRMFFAIEPSSKYMSVRVESPFKCGRKGKVVNKIFNHCNRNPDFTSERTKQSEIKFKVPAECFSVTARKYLLETKPPEISEYTWTFSHFFNMLQKILDSYTYTYWWQLDGWKLPAYCRLKYRIK